MAVVSSISELQKAIAGYESLISNYTLARERMLERRRSAVDHVMVELDERLEANARTIEALNRALEISREHLNFLERAGMTVSRDSSG